MPKLIVPLDKSYSITIESRHSERRVTEDDPIVVTFKQATEALNLKRQEMLARPITRMWEEEKYQEQWSMTPFARRMATDVWLTMTFCNIEGADGKKLFSFSQLNGSNRIMAKTLEEFLKLWGQLWPEWAEEIYARCLETNPSWGLGGEAENEDEQVLTLGEDAAGEPATESTPSLASA